MKANLNLMKKEAKNRVDHRYRRVWSSYIQCILIAYYCSRAEGVPITPENTPENTRKLVTTITIYVILLFD